MWTCVVTNLAYTSWWMVWPSRPTRTPQEKRLKRCGIRAYDSQRTHQQATRMGDTRDTRGAIRAHSKGGAGQKSDRGVFILKKKKKKKKKKKASYVRSG